MKAVKACEFPFDAKKQQICINPYHYDRVEYEVLPPIVVPRSSEYAPGFSFLSQTEDQSQNSERYMPNNVIYGNNDFNAAAAASSSRYTPISDYSSGQSSPLSGISNSSCSYSQQYNQCQLPQDQSYVNNAQLTQMNPTETVHVQVRYETPTFWATVAYYELNCRVGEAFRCNSNTDSVTIDGFTNPSGDNSNRFCLGQLSNVNRNSTVSIFGQTEENILSQYCLKSIQNIISD